MSKAFSPWLINNLNLPNRLVRSATWEGMAEVDGSPSRELTELYKDLAANKAGLLITGLLSISPRGKVAAAQVGLHSDDLIKPLKQMVDEVHKSGGLIAAQIAHAGGQTTPKAIGGEIPMGPSAGTNLYTKAQVAELTVEQIRNIIEEFAAAALRAKQAGFDAVQLHMAHAYLISQFLSPFTNRRTDEYGGNAQKRRRFALEVYAAVRQAVGAEYPLLIKINALDEAVDNGLDFTESLQAMEELARLGIDAIEVSGGIGGGDPELSPSRKVKSAADEGYFLDYAIKVKKAVKCPVISVGGWRSLGQVEKALDEIDAVSLSRALICQPDLFEMWSTGESLNARCTSCNRCFVLTPKYGLTCALNRTAAVKDKN